MHILNKIVSGGQTGVDLAALDFGLKHHIPIGGWCPKGRLNENGKIPKHYPLLESTSAMNSVRTELNVKHSDATLVISSEKLIDQGTKLCIDFCKEHNKPYFVYDIMQPEADQLKLAKAWIWKQSNSILNIAGNRESTFPGIYFKAYTILQKLLASKTQFQ